MPTPSAEQRRIFTDVFHRNAWGERESVSGPGSTLARGADFADDLVQVLGGLRITSILDAPCGDFNWMRLVLDRMPVSYVGIDIVEELIERNKGLYGSESRTFLCRDLTTDDLPDAELILCRDALVHLSFADIRAAVRNMKRSSSRYLLATTFIGDRRNEDIPTGSWRPLNMQARPIGFPEPLALIDERCTHTGGMYRDKRLALWEIETLPG